MVYFRAGYEPAQYHSDVEWDARITIERSRAIKCPSIHYHLAGTKKVSSIFNTTACVDYILPSLSAPRAVINLIFNATQTKCLHWLHKQFDPVSVTTHECIHTIACLACPFFITSISPCPWITVVCGVYSFMCNFGHPYIWSWSCWYLCNTVVS